MRSKIRNIINVKIGSTVYQREIRALRAVKDVQLHDLDESLLKIHHRKI